MSTKNTPKTIQVSARLTPAQYDAFVKAGIQSEPMLRKDSEIAGAAIVEFLANRGIVVADEEADA